jgi:hypothetical protein
MLHEARQRHAVRRGELAHRDAALGEGVEHRAAGRIGESGKDAVELVVGILNHKV